MCTLYLTEHGSKVSKSGGKFVITKPNKEVVEVPSGYIDCILVMGRIQLTTDVITEMLSEGKSIVYLNRYGDVVGKTTGLCHESEICLLQLQVYANEEKRLAIAKKLVEDKLAAQKSLLSYYNKRLHSEKIKENAANIANIGTINAEVGSPSGLMGIEGYAARLYYECFKEIIRNDSFVWEGRRKFPAPDPVNSMLSYAYTLLEKDVRVYLAEINNLLLSIGFLHETNFRKDSLVYDLMEPFRAEVDRYVLKCINLKEYGNEDFSIAEGRCYFSEASRKRFIAGYEEFVGSYDGAGLRAALKRYVKEIVGLIKASAGEYDTKPVALSLKAS